VVENTNLEFDISDNMTHFWDKVNIVHLSFKWENYLNSFSNKTVTIFMDRQQKNGLNVIPIEI
jgi:hypothetical protein